MVHYGTHDNFFINRSVFIYSLYIKINKVTSITVKYVSLLSSRFSWLFLFLWSCTNTFVTVIATLLFWLCQSVTLVNIQPVLFVYCTDIWNEIFEVDFFFKVSVTFYKIVIPLKIMQFHGIGLHSSDSLNSSPWCEVGSSHSNVAEDSSPLGCDAMNVRI